MSGRHDCGGDAAAYALGALSPTEAEAFETHMADCIVCRDELAALQRVSDALAMAAPQYEAPKQLRRAVMRVVRAESQEAAKAPRRRSIAFGSAFTLRPALAAGFAVVLAAVVLGAVLLGSGGTSTHVWPARVGLAEVRITGGRGELVVEHLPAPAAGRIYEVWLKRDGQPPSPTSTLFSVTAGGRSDVGLPDNLTGVKEILVTSEPAGGSRVPTRPPVIVAPLTKSA